MSADEEREAVDVLESDTGTFGHSEEGILGYMELDTDLIGQTLVETAGIDFSMQCEIS